jgi:hypothetical protein
MTPQPEGDCQLPIGPPQRLVAGEPVLRPWTSRAAGVTTVRANLDLCFRRRYAVVAWSGRMYRKLL